MTDYDILASSLVSVGCLAKTKAYHQSKSSEKIRLWYSFTILALFVKEDRETGKVVQKPCLFVRQSQRATRQSQTLRLCRVIVAHSCDKIAR